MQSEPSSKPRHPKAISHLTNKLTIPLHLSINQQIRFSSQSSSIKSTKQTHSKQSFGLVAFPSQPSKTKIGQVQIKTSPHKQTISYRSTIQSTDPSTGEPQEGSMAKGSTSQSKRVNQYSKITIKPKQLKNKQFIITVPITNKSQPNNFLSMKNLNNAYKKEHFIIQFNNKQGRLTLVQQYHDANVEVINIGGTGEKGRRKGLLAGKTTSQIVQMQRKRLDNRRKEQDFGAGGDREDDDDHPDLGDSDQ